MVTDLAFSADTGLRIVHRTVTFAPVLSLRVAIKSRTASVVLLADVDDFEVVLPGVPTMAQRPRTPARRAGRGRPAPAADRPGRRGARSTSSCPVVVAVPRDSRSDDSSRRRDADPRPPIRGRANIATGRLPVRHQRDAEDTTKTTRPSLAMDSSVIRTLRTTKLTSAACDHLRPPTGDPGPPPSNRSTVISTMPLRGSLTPTTTKTRPSEWVSRVPMFKAAAAPRRSALTTSPAGVSNR
jgi:hypothetical protein